MPVTDLEIPKNLRLVATEDAYLSWRKLEEATHGRSSS